MAESTASRPSLNAEEALWVAEALSTQIEAQRGCLDHRSLFSAAFNRKLVRKIEVLDRVRGEYLDLAAQARREAQEEAAKYG